MNNSLGLDCHELFLITMYSPITTLSASENRSMQFANSCRPMSTVKSNESGDMGFTFPCCLSYTKNLKVGLCFASPLHFSFALSLTPWRGDRSACI